MSEDTKPKWANPVPLIYHAIALWAASCAERALPIFEEQRPGDDRPPAAIASVRVCERGELPMTGGRTDEDGEKCRTDYFRREDGFGVTPLVI